VGTGHAVGQLNGRTSTTVSSCSDHKKQPPRRSAAERADYSAVVPYDWQRDGGLGGEKPPKADLTEVQAGHASGVVIDQGSEGDWLTLQSSNRSESMSVASILAARRLGPRKRSPAARPFEQEGGNGWLITGRLGLVRLLARPTPATAGQAPPNQE
jgi:hypothetical protein